MQLKPMGKVVVLILAVGVALGVWRYWNKLAPSAAQKPNRLVIDKLLPCTVMQNSIFW